MIGRTISHYRVLERIGAGGMGEVYRGHDEQLDRDVALKFLPTGALGDEAARQQFRKEALALAKLNHPNIATVFEFSNEDGIDFLAMELIPGRTLSEMLTEGPLAEAEIVRLGAQVAEGLSAAHERGVIHRDLKPSNLMVVPDGRLKILDFGLAKVARSNAEADLTRATLSETASISGTLPYMSPEQLRGLPIDTRSDIYASGAVLYEMATGKRPFPQSQGAELMGAILHTSPTPPRSLNPEISNGLERAIAIALEKEPSQRYQSARELRVALESVKNSNAAVTANARSSVRPEWRRIAIYGAGSVALLTCLVLGLKVGPFARRDFALFSKRAATASPFSIPTRPSIAVLGFKNVSGRPDKAWLSTALSEMLTTELAAGEQLRTVPGENIAQMKINLSLPDAESYGQQTLQKIHANLNVDDVVLGSFVPLTNDEIRLDLRLQDAVRGETVASFAETGSERQIDDLVDRVATELRPKLGVGTLKEMQFATRAALPSSPDAAKYYAEGLEKLRVFDAAQSVPLFQKAIAAEPEFGLSHSSLATAWSTLGHDHSAQAEAKIAFDLSKNLPREQRLWIEGRYHESTYDWPKAIESYKALADVFPDNVDYGLQLAAAEIAAGRPASALNSIEQLRRLPKPLSDDPRLALAEANAASNMGDFKRAQAAADSAVAQGRSTDARVLVAHALLTEGEAWRDLGRTKEALQLADEARQIFSAAGDTGGVASALINRGNLLYRLGDMSAARHTWEESLSISRDIGYQTDIATSLNNLGNVCWSTGDLKGAQTLFDQSLTLSQRLGNPLKTAQSLSGLAGLLYDQGDLVGAARKEQEALKIFQRVGERSGIALASANLGMIDEDQENFSGALEKYQEALAAYRDLGEQSGIASTTNKLGNLFYVQSKILDAKTMYEQSFAASTAIGNRNGMVLAQGNLGNTYYNLGDLAQARKMYEASISAARVSENKSSLAEGLKNLGDLFLAQADFEAAERSYKEALPLKQQLADEAGVLDCQLGFAALSVEQGHSAAAEAAARQIATKYRKAQSSLNEAGARALLAYSLFRQRKNNEAVAEIGRARTLATKSQQTELRLPVEIMAARIDGVCRKDGASLQQLQSIVEQATSQGQIAFQLQARLALADVELSSGEKDAAMSHLRNLQEDATTKGFLLIAHQAAALEASSHPR